MTEDDFGRGNGAGIFTLFVVLVVLVPGPAILISYLLNDLRSNPAKLHASLPYLMGVAAVYLAAFGLILFYGVFDAYRYRLTDEGLMIRGLTGWRLTRWTAVTRATVTSGRGVALVLFTGQRTVRILPLGNYRRMRSLVEEVSKRIGTPVEIAPHLQPVITDR